MFKIRLGTKLTAIIIGVLCVGSLSSVLGLVVAYRFERYGETFVNANLASVLAAEELEIALLEQRGYVSAYVLDDGNQYWLNQLQSKVQGFAYWLEKAREAAHTPEERELLDQLEQVQRRYAERRREVVRLFDEGQREQARRMLLSDVVDLYEEAFDLCEDFIAANADYVETTTDRMRRQVKLLSAGITVCVIATLCLGAGLIWMLFSGILLPLRRMAADARSFSGFSGESPMHDGTLDSDELRDVGRYMRLLVANVAVARSDLKRSQHQLAHAERLASVGKLAASVAHEIRNPLTAMKMWIFTIRRGSDKSPELEHKFDLVAEEIARLENIIHNFLEFSRPPQLRIQRLSLSELLTKTIELLQHRLDESGCQVEVREPRSLPDVLADQAQLKQVFMNLLTNSMETMPEGGSIRLDCATGELHGQSMVVVRVTDQGAGMTSDVQSRVFEPFFTTKDSGTGLGLCIAASIMARHDGALMLENTTSAGTVFAVWIPTWEDSDRE